MWPALKAQAQWSTNQVWPAASNAAGRAAFIDFDGVARTGTVKDARIADGAWATAERVAAPILYGDTNSVRPYWYLWERACMVADKDALGTYTPQYIDTTLADGSGHFTAETYWNAEPGTSNRFPFLTTSQVVARASLPTHFLTQTPWIALSKSTQGWDGIRTYVTNLQWTEYGSLIEGKAKYGYGTSAVDLASAMSAAESDFAAATEVDLPAGSPDYAIAYATTNGYTSNYVAQCYRARYRFTNDSYSIYNGKVVADLYVKIVGNETSGDLPMSYTNRAFLLQFPDGVNTSAWYGTTANPPAWPTGTNEAGYSLAPDLPLVIRWDEGTNGFKYK